MLSIYPVEIDGELNRSNPLYVGNFFPLKGMWWSKRKQRQGLIISMAIAWHRLTRKSPSNPGFLENEILITSLTRQVKDARVILEHFFDVKRIGYNFGGENKSPSVVSPKRLSKQMRAAIEEILCEAKFSPGAPPPERHYTTSDVHVRPINKATLIAKLSECDRDDLIAPVSWLLEQKNPIRFMFEASGNLQARDKSVWPIRSIERWPAWLRLELFGTVVDIENSFVQYIVQNLEKKYQNNPNRLMLKYPDLIRAHRDKKNFRDELCRDILRLPITSDNLKIVKSLIMALANGSNATPALMTNGSTRSEAVRIVLEACPHLSATEHLKIGKYLSGLVKQFKGAKRDLCIFMFNAKPTKENVRRVFHHYFEWEREARYKIHEIVGKTGLHLHDGIDGIVCDIPNKELVDLIYNTTSIRVSVESPEEICHESCYSEA